MGKPAKTKCKEIIEKIEKDGITKEIEARKLKFYLMNYIGADDRTINKYVRLMVDFGFIKLAGAGIFEITKETRNLL